MMARIVGISGLAAMGLGGCTEQSQEREFEVLQTLRIDESLVNVLVETRGPDAQARLSNYADCVAAKYAADRDLGFVRHIRTNQSKTGGNWRADAVYSVTSDLPEGQRITDANIAVRNCDEFGIPTG